MSVQEFASEPTEQPVPDNDPTGIEQSLEVDADGTIEGLSVTVDLEHTYSGDLEVTLTKGEQRVVLHNRADGGDDFRPKTFEVPALVGAQLRGAYTLHVSDHANRDEGTLRGFSLRVHTRTE